MNTYERWKNKWDTDMENMPWESYSPDQNLVSYIRKNVVRTAIDVGCAIGTNAKWMSSLGIETDAIDVCDKLIFDVNDDINFIVGDFLFIDDLPNYDLVFDRGCFHGFTTSEERYLFVQKVSKILSPTGKWLSIIGADIGPYLHNGPPRKKASEICSDVESLMDIESINLCNIKMFDGTLLPAWSLIAKNKSWNIC